MADLLSGALSAVGSLGGLFGKKAKSYSPREMVVGHVEGAMQAAEAFGLHPLAVLGNVGGPSAVSASGGNYLGSAIADSAMMLADGLAQREDAQKLERANKVNEALQRKVTDLTLRPKVGGVYQQFGGVSNAGMVASKVPSDQNTHHTSGGGDTGLGQKSDLGTAENVLMPERPKDVVPAANVSGLFEIQNKLTADRPITLYGESADDVTDLLFQLPAVIPQVGFRWGQKIAGQREELKEKGIPVFKIGGKEYALQPGKPKPKPKAKPRKYTGEKKQIGRPAVPSDFY